MAQAVDVAGLNSHATDDKLLESLARLSKKTGVLATIILDRSSGAILKTIGSLSSSRISLNVPSSGEESTTRSHESQGIDEMAAMVWKFVNATGGLIQGFDSEDEVKLLRLRTKRYELVIVPDPKYLLIVVHETPAA